MSSTTWAQILAPIIGVLLTVIYRLVDKWIPDEEGKHPLPTAETALGRPHLRVGSDRFLGRETMTAPLQCSGAVVR
jgi:hypothetical protein